MDQQSKNKESEARALTVHSFCDLSHVPPLVFLFLLKECYTYGTCKATHKFRVLQNRVYQDLWNNPQPGPAVYVARCLYILPIFETYCEGFTHLLTSILRQFMTNKSIDIIEAKLLSAQLFVEYVRGKLVYDEKIVIRILQVFSVELIHIQKVMSDLEEKSEGSFGKAEELVEQYIARLIDTHSYMNAISLLEHFSIRSFEKSFLSRIMDKKDFKAAEKWANYMGKSTLCLLVQEYVDRKLLAPAYEVIKKNNLRNEFPEVCQQCKENSLKKFAEKGLWDIAEERTNKDKHLLEYLVYLAMEAGYTEKVEELSTKYSLNGFVNVMGSGINTVQSHYLSLEDLSVEEIIFVNEVNGLYKATQHIEEGKLLGIDCEWKPNYEKGKQSKVSIMQIASGNKVYIIDLIKLYNDVPEALDTCLTRIFKSPSILKLGYNFKCDMHQLSHSYGKLQCFKNYEMVLDIQNVFKEPNGGLAKLAEKILGAPLNKTRRNSNWEQRPLSPQQLEYAALDAACLIHIFRHVPDHTPAQGDGVSDGHTNIEWKSHIV